MYIAVTLQFLSYLDPQVRFSDYVSIEIYASSVPDFETLNDAPGAQ